MDREKLIAEIMAEAEKDGEPVTREEAEEMAEMDIKAKGEKRYEVSEPTKEKRKREVKLDETKVDFITTFAEYLEDMGFEGVKVINPQREVGFRLKDEDYSITLIKHRKPKENKGKIKNFPLTNK